MAALCQEALAVRAVDSPRLGFVLRNFFDICLLSHTNFDSCLKPLSFCCRGAVLGEASICARKEDSSPEEKQQNFAKIIIEFEDPSGKLNPNLKGLPSSEVSETSSFICQPPERSTQTDFCRQSETADDTRKKPLESGKEKKSTCTCGRAAKLGEP